MSDIQRGSTFTTGIPDAPSLHNLVDNATILPTFITSKAVAVPGAGDRFVYVDALAGAFRQTTLSRLIQAFPNGGPGNQFALRKLGTTAQSAAAGNDSRLQSQLPVGSVRVAQNTAPDTAGTPDNLIFPPYSMINKTVIDWSKSNVFTDVLTFNKIYTFSNMVSGRTIQVIIDLNGHTSPTMPGLFATVGTNTPVNHHYFLTYIASLGAVFGILVKI